MPVYHCHKPALLGKWPSGILMRFSQGSIPESLVGKKIKIDKVIQHLLKVTPPKEYKKNMFSTNL